VPAGDAILTVATFNFEAGGWSADRDDYRNLRLLPEVIAQVPGLDVLFLQESRSWDSDGSRLLLEAEALLAPAGPLRGFLTPSDRGLLHEVVFIRWPRLRPVRHYLPGPRTYHDQVGWLRVVLDGRPEPIALKSVQWPHWSGDARLDQALRMTGHAAPGELAVIGGDFNSLWPGGDEFEPDWAALPRHGRPQKTLPPGARPHEEDLVSDRRALTVLAEAGFVSVGALAGDYTVTVNRHIDHGQGARIDHIVLSPRLAGALVPGSYRVWVNDLGDKASDHRLVSARLDLSKLAH
jgi:endonuclease/exonuclease/phosphatase family metal-dependent hydrolase